MNTKPSPRDRIAELVIIIACSGGAWWMAAKPFHDRAQVTAAQLAEARDRLASASDVRAGNPDRAAAIMDTVAKWSAAHADPLRVGSLLQQDADDTGVHIDRLTPADDDATHAFGSLSMTSRRYEMITTGNARSVISFLDAIDRHPLIVVDYFELVTGENDRDVVALVHIGVTRLALADATSNGATR